MRSAGPAAVAVAIALATSPASAETARRVDARYAGGGVQGAFTLQGSAQGGTFGGVRFAVEPAERFVRVELHDDLGGAVAAEVAQLVDGQTGELRFLAEVCGGTEEPIELALPGADLVVTPMTGLCDYSPSAPSSGTVRVALTHQRW